MVGLGLVRNSVTRLSGKLEGEDSELQSVLCHRIACDSESYSCDDSPNGESAVLESDELDGGAVCGLDSVPK